MIYFFVFALSGQYGELQELPGAGVEERQEHGEGTAR